MSDDEQPDDDPQEWFAGGVPSLADTHAFSGDVEVSDEIRVPFDRFDRITVERDGVVYELVADGEGIAVVEADE